MANNYIFNVDWFTSHIPIWTNILGHYKNKNDLQFLEIGSFEGLSSVWLLKNILTHESSSLTCIDTFEGSVEHHNSPQWQGLLPKLYDVFMHNISAFQNKVIVKQGKSQKILKELSLQDNTYDFIYVDGDHLASSVMQDAVLSFSMLKIGGIMCFDDYNNVGNHDDKLDMAQCAINAFIKLYANKINVLHVGWQVIVQKIAD